MSSPNESSPPPTTAGKVSTPAVVLLRRRMIYIYPHVAIRNAGMKDHCCGVMDAYLDVLCSSTLHAVLQFLNKDRSIDILYALDRENDLMTCSTLCHSTTMKAMKTLLVPKTLPTNAGNDS
jgi:hypothetical protein